MTVTPMLLATQCLWALLTRRHSYPVSKGNKLQMPDALIQLEDPSDKQSGLGISCKSCGWWQLKEVIPPPTPPTALPKKIEIKNSIHTNKKQTHLSYWPIAMIKIPLGRS